MLPQRTIKNPIKAVGVGLHHTHTHTHTHTHKHTHTHIHTQTHLLTTKILNTRQTTFGIASCAYPHVFSPFSTLDLGPEIACRGDVTHWCVTPWQ